MRQLRFSFIVVCSVIIGFTSCTKDDVENVTVVSKVVNDLVADTIQGYDAMGNALGATGIYTFYSLERGEVVTDTSVRDWDIAFNGSTIRINGGTSGNKLGGAFIQNGVFADITAVSPDSTFRVDNFPTYAIPRGNNKGWYTLTFFPDFSSVLTPIAGKVLIIRTASGKYAKVEVICYYKGGVTPSASSAKDERYYKFQYSYQSNGSKTF